MKRREFLRHLADHGCVLDREGGNHSIYRNPVPPSPGIVKSRSTTGTPWLELARLKAPGHEGRGDLRASMLPSKGPVHCTPLSCW